MCVFVNCTDHRFPRIWQRRRLCCFSKDLKFGIAASFFSLLPISFRTLPATCFLGVFTKHFPYERHKALSLYCVLTFAAVIRNVHELVTIETKTSTDLFGS